jgi:hypothetical protein
VKFSKSEDDRKKNSRNLSAWPLENLLHENDIALFIAKTVEHV